MREMSEGRGVAYLWGRVERRCCIARSRRNRIRFRFRFIFGHESSLGILSALQKSDKIQLCRRSRVGFWLLRIKNVDNLWMDQLKECCTLTQIHSGVCFSWLLTSRNIQFCGRIVLRATHHRENISHKADKVIPDATHAAVAWHGKHISVTQKHQVSFLISKNRPRTELNRKSYE